MCFRHCPEYRNRIGTVCFMETLFRVYRTNIMCTSMKLTGNFVHSLSSLLGMYPCILFLRIEETGNKTI